MMETTGWGTATQLLKCLNTICLLRSYEKKTQVKTMQQLLGTNTAPSGDALIEKSRRGTRYFAKGHLAPDAAFIYDVLQDATYYFVNVAPQFQTFK